MIRRLLILSALAAAAIGTGCTYERHGPPSMHYSDFRTEAPRGNTVTVCHAYGCQKQTRIRFTAKDLDTIHKIMRKTKLKDTPHEERRAVAYAVSWMEKRVGKVTGTDKDNAGMEFNGSGDPTQQDCVDEATNTTSYLLVLEHNKFLKHHKVGTPFSKGNILMGIKYWPHWTAVLKEHNSGQRWAVDSWIYKNGENPAIVKAETWYIKDLDRLPKPLS